MAISHPQLLLKKAVLLIVFGLIIQPVIATSHPQLLLKRVVLLWLFEPNLATYHGPWATLVKETQTSRGITSAIEMSDAAAKPSRKELPLSFEASSTKATHF